MPRRAARKDGNHNDIVAGLEKAGFSVLDLSRLGDGCPDLLVCWGERQLLVEVKRDRGTLTDRELAFFDRWPIGMAVVARTVEDVLREFGRI